MAGATYSVNIELNHKAVSQQVDKINQDVKRIGKEGVLSSKKKNEIDKEGEKIGKHLITDEKQRLLLASKRQKVNTRIVRLEDKGKYMSNLRVKNQKDYYSLAQLTEAQTNKEWAKGKVIVDRLGLEVRKVEDKLARQNALNVARQKELNIAIKLRKLGDSAGSIGTRITNLNRGKKVGPGGGTYGLPSSSMLNANARGIQNLNKIGSLEARKLRRMKRMLELEKEMTAENRKRNNMAKTNFVGPGGVNYGKSKRPGLGAIKDYRRGKVWQSAAISGAFPLLFGQGPVTAAAGALGGGLGAKYGGQMGGFAGGLAATALVSSIGRAVVSVKDLSEAINPLKFNADKAIESLGFLNSERAREIKLIEKTRGSNAALLEVRKDLQERYGPSGLEALDKFDTGWAKFMKGFKTSLTDIKVSFATFVDSVISDTKAMHSLGLESMSKENPLLKQYNDLTKQIELASDVSGPNAINNMLAGNAKASMFNQSIVLTRQGKENLANLKKQRANLGPEIISAGVDAKAVEIVGAYNAKFKEQVGIQEYNLDVQKRILELRSKGINPAIAKTMVSLEQMNETTIELLENKAQALEADIQSSDLSVKDKEIKILALEALREEITDQKVLNQLKIDGVVADMEANAAKERQLALWKDIGSTIKSGLVEGINAAIDGTKSLGEIAGNVFRKISNALLDFGVSLALSKLPIPGAEKFFGFANGGRPPKGRPSIVGERGPELFVPDSAGTIIPNHEMGGANVVVNVDASGSSVEGDAGQAEQLGSMLGAAVQAEIARQQRPGGLLAAR